MKPVVYHMHFAYYQFHLWQTHTHAPLYRENERLKLECINGLVKSHISEQISFSLPFCDMLFFAAILSVTKAMNAEERKKLPPNVYKS